MSGTFYFLSMALVGLDLGYRPLPNGTGEFIIQVDPATLQSLRPGTELPLVVPREAQAMRPGKFTIFLGDGPLPHEVPIVGQPDQSPAAAVETSSSDAKPSFDGLQPVGSEGSNAKQSERSWLSMWLLVIALGASNFYVGWLFVDARQRHQALLARSLRSV